MRGNCPTSPACGFCFRILVVQLLMAKARRKTPKSGASATTGEFRVHRTRMAIHNLTDRVNDVRYWRSQTPGARLAYMEYLRLINYGEAAVTGRLKRVFEVTQLHAR